MTAREFAKWEELAKIDIDLQRNRVQEAKVNLDQGYNKLMAEMEREYNKLKVDYKYQLLLLQKEEVRHKYAQEDAENGFD